MIINTKLKSCVVLYVVLIFLNPNLVLAQVSRGLKAGESLSIEKGTALVVHSALQSGIGGAPGFDCKCVVTIGDQQVPIGINPFILKEFGVGGAVIAGPAKLAVVSDSIITYRIIQSTNFVSRVVTNEFLLPIEIESGRTCRLYAPLWSNGYYARHLTASVKNYDITLADTTLYPPMDLSGPSVIRLIRVSQSQAEDPRYIVTLETFNTQVAPIIQNDAQGGIRLESSTDMIRWDTVLTTNRFSGARGFFRLRN
jgi:hypothetical protein